MPGQSLYIKRDERNLLTRQWRDKIDTHYLNAHITVGAGETEQWPSFLSQLEMASMRSVCFFKPTDKFLHNMGSPPTNPC